MDYQKSLLSKSIGVELIKSDCVFALWLGVFFEGIKPSLYSIRNGGLPMRYTDVQFLQLVRNHETTNMFAAKVACQTLHIFMGEQKDSVRSNPSKDMLDVCVSIFSNEGIVKKDCCLTHIEGFCASVSYYSLDSVVKLLMVALHKQYQSSNGTYH